MTESKPCVRPSHNNTCLDEQANSAKLQCRASGCVPGQQDVASSLIASADAATFMNARLPDASVRLAGRQMAHQIKQVVQNQTHKSSIDCNYGAGGA